MRIAIPEFQSKKDRLDYLIANKSKLIAQKKSLPIVSDPCFFSPEQVTGKSFSAKANAPVLEDIDVLRVKTVANTAYFIDSHLDMILPDAPLKSIKERKGVIPHLHDHIHRLDAEIGDVVDIYLQDVSLFELGLNKAGTAQALIFITDISKAYNDRIFQRYKSGKVKQHSIGLQYMKLQLAINDEDYKEEFELWNKYIEKAINPEVAEHSGYFWIVPEYKLIENSAVLFGSNSLTPTLDNNLKAEPVATTRAADPSEDNQILDALNQLLNKLQN